MSQRQPRRYIKYRHNRTYYLFTDKELRDANQRYLRYMKKRGRKVVHFERPISLPR